MTTYFYATKSGAILTAEVKGNRTYTHGVVAEMADGSAALLRQSATLEAAETGRKSKMIREAAESLGAVDVYVVEASLTATEADAAAEAEFTQEEIEILDRDIARNDAFDKRWADKAKKDAKKAEKPAKVTKAKDAPAEAKLADEQAAAKGATVERWEEGPMASWNKVTFADGSWIKTRRRQHIQASGKVVYKINRWAGESAEDEKGHDISSAKAKAAHEAGRYTK